MLKVGYSVEFIRLYEKLNPQLQVEVKNVIELFKNRKNHLSLHVHKLHGRQTGLWSFDVNYRERIIFEYLDKAKKSTLLHQVGDHGIYK